MMEILGNMYENNKALRRNPESAPSLHFNFRTREMAEILEIVQ